LTTKSSNSSKSEYYYRNGKFLMSLIDEMEREYGFVPNSYVLSGVLLGVDDVDESIAILGEFERRYGRSSEEEEEEEREEEEEEGGGDDGEEDDGEEEEEEGGEDGEDGGDDNGGIVTVQVYNVVIALISRLPLSGRTTGGRGRCRCCGACAKRGRSRTRSRTRTYWGRAPRVGRSTSRSPSSTRSGVVVFSPLLPPPRRGRHCTSRFSGRAPMRAITRGRNRSWT
jgi:hypothetical protein